MKFRTYLDQNGISLTEIAARLDKPVTTVHGWLSGRRTPKAADLAAIEALTEGAVTAKDFCAVEQAA